MTFDLRIPKNESGSENLEITLNAGDAIFILGANGNGKSSLISRLISHYPHVSRRISAHRQNWFEDSTVTMTGRGRREYESRTRQWDTDYRARFIELGATERTQILLYDLIDAENVTAREIKTQLKAGNVGGAQHMAAQATPIDIINELFTLSGLPLKLFIRDNDKLVVSKSGGPEFNAAQMSDGERNAMLIAAHTLTAPSGSLIFIDEPERHLHRSIISPLLSELFSRRTDCGFIISTHEPMLPLDNVSAKTLLLRGCTHQGNDVRCWDVDLMEPRQDIDEGTKREILGSRKKLLFVEGIETSLDKPIYSLIFPTVSVIAKSSCRDVEDAVSGIRDACDLHWVKAFGIVDSDRRPQEDIDALRADGIYALDVYSVEAIYYHEQMQTRLAARQSAITGRDATAMLQAAKAAALHAVSPHAERLCARVAEKAVRQKIFQSLPERG